MIAQLDIVHLYTIVKDRVTNERQVVPDILLIDHRITLSHPSGSCHHPIKHTMRAHMPQLSCSAIVDTLDKIRRLSVFTNLHATGKRV